MKGREIKFRVWLNEPVTNSAYGVEYLPAGWWPDQSTSKYWLNLLPNGEIAWGVDDDVGCPYEVNATIEQFTGLRDCTRADEHPQGVEIYDGDIVVYDSWERAIPLKVYWSNKFSGWFVVSAWEIDSKMAGDPLGIDGEIRVVGNVHEHGHLLEGE